MQCITCYALGLAWYIVVDARAAANESYEMFALNRNEIKTDFHICGRLPESQESVRLPSVHEFDFISSFSGGAAFIGRDWLYWTSVTLPL
jgi:hypothetical protein